MLNQCLVYIGEGLLHASISSYLMISISACCYLKDNGIISSYIVILIKSVSLINIHGILIVLIWHFYYYIILPIVKSYALSAPLGPILGWGVSTHAIYVQKSSDVLMIILMSIQDFGMYTRML
jgi:hypothetical protein